ncbi:hypothetical protein ABW21_db0205991 [Orbilia brochopaga]|nr:hypothetical protein ABW21_db0205991 [Drechslerella brochopaga]
MDPIEPSQSPDALLRAVDAFSTAAALTRKRKWGASGPGLKQMTECLPTDADSRLLFNTAPEPAPTRSSSGDSKAASTAKQQRLVAPVPNTVQLRRKRQTAYTNTKETLERWLDTVKSMRDAEQLTFPTVKQTKDNRALNAVALSAPPLAELDESSHNLESKVAQALSIDALKPADKSQKNTSTATFKRADDKRAHIAHLRMERELIIRREAKAKRLKRIKSKAYRRILKREAQRIASKMEDLDAAAGDDDSASTTSETSDNVLQESLKDAEEIQDPPEPDRPVDGLPGWGTWSNSKRPARDSKKIKNPAAASRLQRPKVSISNKYSKKSAKYVASGVPFPFESREQYERSLRFPVGQEWSTKQIHQSLSAPRTIVEVGRTIAPLSIPR